MITTVDTSQHSHFSFDLWLTVIKSHPEFKAKRVELFSAFFNLNLPLDEVANAVKYYDDLCNTINEVSGGNIDTFEIYLMILGSLKIDIKTISKKSLQEFYDRSEALFLEYKPVVIFENLHQFFEEIKNQGKTINVLSNTGFIKGSTMRKFLSAEKLDQYIDFQIYSDETNCSKPNMKIFQEVKNKMSRDLPLDQILHIGDNEVADYQGAKDFGFDAFLIKHKF